MILSLLALLLPACGVQDDKEKADIEYAQSIATGLNDGEAEALDRAVDVEAMANRALAALSVTDEWKRGYRNGLKQDFSFGKPMAQAISTKSMTLAALMPTVIGYCSRSTTSTRASRTTRPIRQIRQSPSA